MKKIISLGIIFLFASGSFAQEQTQRSPLNPENWGVVYDVPATKNVRVKTDVPYSGRLTIDIYTPPGAKADEKLPAVVFLNAIGDQPDNKLKNWEIYRSYPRLVAAHGLVGISMEADGARIQENLRALFDFLEKDGALHGIDASRLGVYAASANTTQSLVYLMSRRASKGIRAAALFYGATPAPETAIRKDLPVLYILAEGDAPGFFGQQAGNLWQRVIEAKAPWTLVYASGLPHAFDAFSDSDDARRIIMQALAFWKTHLEPVPQPAWERSPARAIVETIYWNDAPKAVELLSKYIAENPSDAAAYAQYGRMLAQLRRLDEAGEAYEKALSLGARFSVIYNGLGQTRLAQRRYEEAAEHLAKAIELGARSGQTYGQLAYAQLALNRNEEALKTYEKAFEAGIPPGAATRGLAYYNMACAHTRLKQTDKAFEMLDKAIDEGYSDRAGLEKDPDLAPLRSDARFQKLLKRLPATDATDRQ